MTPLHPSYFMTLSLTEEAFKPKELSTYFNCNLQPFTFSWSPRTARKTRAYEIAGKKLGLSHAVSFLRGGGFFCQRATDNPMEPSQIGRWSMNIEAEKNKCDLFFNWTKGRAMTYPGFIAAGAKGDKEGFLLCSDSHGNSHIDKIDDAFQSPCIIFYS